MSTATLVDAVAVWGDLLRSYGRALGEQRAILLAIDADDDIDLVDLVLPVFAGPADAPEMPVELQPLAQALLDETERLMDLARSIAARLPAPTAMQRPIGNGIEGGAFDRAI